MKNKKIKNEEELFEYLRCDELCFIEGVRKDLKEEIKEERSEKNCNSCFSR